MNPKQRRGVLFLVASGVVAIAVVVGLATYTSNVNARVGDKIAVLQLDRDVSAFAPINASSFHVREVPRRWVGPDSVRSAAELAGRITAVTLPAGTYLETSMLRPELELKPGQREVSILINAETGVAGRIQRGDRVDVLATFAGDDRTRQDEARVVVSHALVLDVGQLGHETKNDAGGGVSTEDVVPVTFALSEQESMAVTYAESFASKVRLARTAPDDDSVVSEWSLNLAGLPGQGGQ
jgi:pilus assembly protein CpaB